MTPEERKEIECAVDALEASLQLIDALQSFIFIYRGALISIRDNTPQHQIVKDYIDRKLKEVPDAYQGL